MNKVQVIINQYNEEGELRAAELFEKAKSSGRIKHDSAFDDYEWYLIANDLRDNARIIFPEELPDKLIKQIKCYLMNLVSRQYSLSLLKAHSSIIIKSARHLNGDWSKLMTIDIESIPKIQHSDAYVLVMFMNYIAMYDIAVKLELEIETKNLHKEKRKRDLPDYHTFITLDFLIYDYFSDAALPCEDLIYYYPILIWWEVGNIIPMRATEYCAMKRDGFHTADGQLFFDFPVTKERAVGSSEIEYEPLSVDERFKRLIQKYNSMVDVIDPGRKYLFSVVPYNERHGKRKNGAVRIVFDRSALMRVLDRFLQDIVVGKYGLPVIPKGTGVSSGLPEYVEHIKIGDVRHMAMYNMLKQGMDPLAIMKIARHKKMSSQTAYTHGVEAIVKSEVEILSMMLHQRSKRRDINLEMAGVMKSRSVILEQMRHEDELAKNSETKLVDMDVCYCTEEHYLTDCPPDSECLLCPYHIAKPEDNDRKHTSMVYQATNDKATKTLDNVISVLKQMVGTANGERTAQELTALKSLQPAINAAAIARMNLMDDDR